MRTRSPRALRVVARHLQSWPVSLALAATCVGSLVFVFTAHADPPPVTYYACVNANTGSLKMTTATGTCRSNEQLISWNQVGPQGPVGATGATGQTGAQGPAGPAGKGGFVANLQGANLIGENMH